MIADRNSSYTDIWRLPLRAPSSGSILFWQWRMLLVACLDTDVSSAAAVGRHDTLDAQHDACPSASIWGFDTTIDRYDTRHSLQGVSIQRVKRLLHQLRDRVPERGVWRWTLWPVAGRLARCGTQRDLRHLWKRTAQRRRVQVQRHRR